jgi:polysaccharide export outer membrane protein
MVSSDCSSRRPWTPIGHLSALVVALLVISLPSRPASAQSSEYAIGPQDVLIITVWEHADLSGKFSVEADGTISFPLIGRTKVGGLTVQSAEQVLQKLLSDGYVRQPQVRIAVEQYRSQQIFVMGEVRSPGGYPFTGELTLLEALAKAGGATERAGSEVVLVRPADGAHTSGPVLPDAKGGASQVTRINLEELQRKGSVGAVELRPRDTIFVPKAETVFVFGHVARPGEYPIRSATTLLQALSLAGGVTDRGSTRRIQVVRIVDGRETKLDIKVHEIVQPGDTIIVRERFF